MLKTYSFQINVKINCPEDDLELEKVYQELHSLVSSRVHSYKHTRDTKDAQQISTMVSIEKKYPPFTGH